MNVFHIYTYSLFDKYPVSGQKFIMEAGWKAAIFNGKTFYGYTLPLGFLIIGRFIFCIIRSLVFSTKGS